MSVNEVLVSEYNQPSSPGRIDACHLPIQRYRHLTTSAKSPYEWDLNEIHHFGIFYKYVDFQTFFREAPEDLGPEWDAWLQADDESDVVDHEKEWEVLEVAMELHDPHHGPQDPESRLNLMDRLMNTLFRLFDYVYPAQRTNRPHYVASFGMCGQSLEAILDHTIIDRTLRTRILLGLHECNCSTGPSGNVKAQIIGQAVAMFVHNNRLRRGRRMAPLTETLIPVVTLCGSSPTFYLIPMTQTLVEDVATGRPSERETVVLVYEPVPRESSLLYNLGMSTPHSRLQITQAFLAFKKYLSTSSTGEPHIQIDPVLHNLYEGDHIHLFS